jgi:hypothetical protein
MPEEALCAAVQDGRLPWMMICGELREGGPNKEIIRKIRPLMEKRGWSWSDVTILRAFGRHP